MKRKQFAATLIVMSIVFICCKNLPPAGKATNSKSELSLVPGDADVAIAQSHWPGVTLAQLSQGYDIFSDKCTDCHETKLPQDFSVEDWHDILPKMGRKAHLDSNQYKAVYRYILAKREAILAAKKQ